MVVSRTDSAPRSRRPPRPARRARIVATGVSAAVTVGGVAAMAAGGESGADAGRNLGVAVGIEGSWGIVPTPGVGATVPDRLDPPEIPVGAGPGVS